MSSNPTIPAPYLSVVATARNDNHGGNLILRMQLFISGLIEQCNRHGVDTELILVEWNPLPDKPRLAEVLNWPADCGRCQVRIIEVPTDVHMRLDHAERLPLFQMIGKNVGIRRARGKFVLATNIDILFSDAVFEYLKSGRMKPGFIYRTNRFDVPSEVPHETSFDEQLEFCRQGVMRRHFFEGSYDVRLRKWVSMRVDVTKNLRGRIFALRWKAVVAWRRLKYGTTNRARHYRHKFFNRARWFYDRVRDRVRWFNHELLQGYRRVRNSALNRTRWLYHRVRDRARWALHQFRNLLRRISNVLRAGIRAATRVAVLFLNALIWCIRLPFFILLSPLKAFREFTRWLRIVVRLPVADVTEFGAAKTGRVKNVVGHNYMLNYAQCALRVRAEHFRSAARVRFRYMAMCLRDAMPRWIDQSRLVPARVNVDSRDERKRALRDYMDVLRSVDLRARATRATVRQIRNKRLKQEELERQRQQRFLERQEKYRRQLAEFEERKRNEARARQKERERQKQQKLRSKQEKQRRINAEWREKKLKKKFEARRLQSLERRQRRAAAEAKRSSPHEPGTQRLANEPMVSPGGYAAAVENASPSTIDVAEPREATAVPAVDVRANGQHSADTSAVTASPEPPKKKIVLQWPNMHTNGCGDFTMLAKEDWEALRGYAEFQMYSMHIDSLLMLCAGHHGFEQQQLPGDAVIYHIEHGIGSGWTPEGNDKLNKRLSDAGIPQISHDQCTAYDASMAANGRAEMFNDENWGFNDIELPETTIHQRPPL